MDYSQLENRIAALEKWKSEKDRKQITFPLDKETLETLGKYFLSKKLDVFYEGGAGANYFPLSLFSQENRGFLIGSYVAFVAYKVETTGSNATVRVGFDYINNKPYTLTGSETVIPMTDINGEAPGGLSPLSNEMVFINVDGNTANLSYNGIDPINISSSGSGNQYFAIY